MSSLEPRVMKRWTDDYKPQHIGYYWLCDDENGIQMSYLSQWQLSMLVKTKYTHWLELEPAPILPESDK